MYLIKMLNKSQTKTLHLKLNTSYEEQGSSIFQQKNAKKKIQSIVILPT